MNKDYGIPQEANQTTASCAGFTPNGLPKVQQKTHNSVENSHTGVSTHSALKKSDFFVRQHKITPPLKTGSRLELPMDASVPPTSI